MSAPADSLSIKPPISGTDTIILASATSSARLKIPADWRTCWVTIEADGCDVYCVFSWNASATADNTAVTTLSSEAPSSHAAGECVKIASGTAKHFDLSRTGRSENQLYLAHKESAASAYVRITRSSGQVTLA